MNLLKKLSIAVVAMCTFIGSAVNVSAYEVEHYADLDDYYSYTSPYYDVLVNTCGRDPFVGGCIGTDEYGYSKDYADGIMSIQFVDMDSDGTKEMIVLDVHNTYYYDEYAGKTIREAARVCASIYTIYNGKAVCLFEDEDAMAVYAGLDTGAPMYGLSERNGKTYFVKTDNNQEGGVSQVNYILEKQGNSTQATALLKAVNVMGCGASYYNKGTPISIYEYKDLAEKYLKYTGRIENTGYYYASDVPYIYGVSSFTADNLIPELDLYNISIFENIKAGIY